MSTLYKNISDLFNELLIDINCQHDTRAYIVGIYEKNKSARFDLSKDSITILFSQARAKQDFLTYQNLADWIFFTNTILPNFQHVNKEYYDTVARLSYYSCYKLINRKWKLFEELSDNFLILEAQICAKLQKFNTQTSLDKQSALFY